MSVEIIYPKLADIIGIKKRHLLNGRFELLYGK